MYQALYRKWRPLCFADVIDQQHITIRCVHSCGRADCHMLICLPVQEELEKQLAQRFWRAQSTASIWKKVTPATSALHVREFWTARFWTL